MAAATVETFFPTVADTREAWRKLTAAHNACERIELALCRAADDEELSVYTLDDELLGALARLASTLELEALALRGIGKSIRGSLR